MKIAITGHTAGIGAAFAKGFARHGHEIVGISKRNGHNIRNIPKIRDMILPCDMWINNAQAGYAQTELVYQIWEFWKNIPNKFIWHISTMLTTSQRSVLTNGMTDVAILSYTNQKRALEDAFYQLKSLSQWPAMTLIRPGRVATQPGQIAGRDGADVDVWVDSLMNFFDTAKEKNLWLEEISLGSLYPDWYRS